MGAKGTLRVQASKPRTYSQDCYYDSYPYTSTPQLPFKRPQIPSNRDHKALNRGTLGGVGIPRIGVLLGPEVRADFLVSSFLEAVPQPPGTGCRPSPGGWVRWVCVYVYLYAISVYMSLRHAYIYIYICMYVSLSLYIYLYMHLRTRILAGTIICTQGVQLLGPRNPISCMVCLFATTSTMAL